MQRLQTSQSHTSWFTKYRLMIETRLSTLSPLLPLNICVHFLFWCDLINCSAFSRLFKSSTLQWWITPAACTDTSVISELLSVSSWGKTQTNVFIYFVERIDCLGEMHCRQKHDLTLQAIMSLVMWSPNNHLSSSLNHEILTRGNNSCSA